MTSTMRNLHKAVAAKGFSFVAATNMHGLLAGAGLRDWCDFSASWDDLGLDTYMADGGRYRRRRHAAFALSADGIRRKPHQPHHQSRDHNPLNGGVERWFAPITEPIGVNPAMVAILKTCFALFDSLTMTDTRPAVWHTEAHQFRVEARVGEHGRPTPEGMHRDSVDWVLVTLIRRENVSSGTTTILDAAGRPLGRFTLRQPFESAVVDDARAFHSVTPVVPINPEQPAFRDVLVVTMRRP